MSIAYHILAHRLPAQVARLVRAIWAPDNLILIHYDKGAPRHEFAALRQQLAEMPNVRFQRRRRILWGRFSVVGAQIEGMRELLDLSPHWSHFINLSGQCFPLRPNRTIGPDLAGAGERSFISSFDPWQKRVWSDVDQRVSRIGVESPALERALTLPGVGRRVRRALGWKNRVPHVPALRRRPPGFFRYFGGSNGVILARNAAEFMAHDQAADRIVRWLRRSLIPDESVFQSVLLNSPLRTTVANDNRRFALSARGSAHPQTLKRDHLQALAEAARSGKLFARKFDAAGDDSALDVVESWVSGNAA